MRRPLPSRSTGKASIIHHCQLALQSTLLIFAVIGVTTPNVINSTLSMTGKTLCRVDLFRLKANGNPDGLQNVCGMTKLLIADVAPSIPNRSGHHLGSGYIDAVA
jgi:hypothetical protein